MGYAVDQKMKELADPKTGLKLENVSDADWQKACDDVMQEFFASKPGNYLQSEFGERAVDVVGPTYDRVHRNNDYPRLTLCGRLIGVVDDLLRTKALEKYRYVAPVEPEPVVPVDARGVALSEIHAEVQRDINDDQLPLSVIKEKRRQSPDYNAAFEAVITPSRVERPSVSISTELQQFANDFNVMSGTPKLVNGHYTVGARQFTREQLDTMLEKSSQAGLIR